FDITALSNSRDDDSAVRRRLMTAFDRFIDVRRMSDEEAAALIEELGVEVLIDLSGFTEGGRPGILAFRPSPVQVNYLGYPGTMGAKFVDYIMADPVIIPKAHEAYYAEKVVRLPDCYQSNDSKRMIAERTPTRAEAGLPETGFVFCCFNN